MLPFKSVTDKKQTQKSSFLSSILTDRDAHPKLF